ncbi:hypothetical protein ZEAMMB73_Zm00001d050950 [Zea mays]|uniref:Uncharacterized protein n=1 Tax=Zea mays TaxID=4577 RepID=A0A1D6Q416_MAIZE|nr:hypothetical protein ZEAMMB73_Zm00001d050950 [Zea mays]
MEMNEERKVSLLGLADILSASIGGFSWAPLISKICKNKVEAEALFTGLSALICRGQHGSQVQHIDGIRIAGLPFDGARESSLSGSSTFTSDSYENKLSSTFESVFPVPLAHPAIKLLVLVVRSPIFLLNMIEASEVILGKHVLENHIDQMSTDEVEQSINRDYKIQTG